MWMSPEVNQAEGRGAQFWGGGREGGGEQTQKQEHPLQNLPRAKVLTLTSGEPYCVSFAQYLNVFN